MFVKQTWQHLKGRSAKILLDINRYMAQKRLGSAALQIKPGHTLSSSAENFLELQYSPKRHL